MSFSATNSDPISHFKTMIREIPDFTKPGILFYDVTTLFKEPIGLHSVEKLSGVVAALAFVVELELLKGSCVAGWLRCPLAAKIPVLKIAPVAQVDRATAS
jgi:hypothetical protein